MKMPNRLTSPSPTVHHDSIPARDQLILTGQAIGQMDGLSEQHGVRVSHIGNRGNVFGGNNQQVRWGLRTDVLEGDEPVSLCYDVCRLRAIGDPAKQAVGSTHAPITKRLALVWRIRPWRLRQKPWRSL